MTIHTYKTLYKVLLGLTLSLLITTGSASTLTAANPAEIPVIFLPFNTQDAAKFAYLQDGISSMFASRMAAKAGIQVVNKTEIATTLAKAWTSGKEQLFRQSLKNVTAQYVMAGTLLPEGEGVRIEVYLFNLAAQEEKKFNTTTADANGILPAIDTLSWEISEKVFGKQRPVTTLKQTTAKNQKTRFQTPHPDKIFKSALLFGLTEKTSGLNSKDFGASVAARSSKLDLELKGMGVSDLDNDGTKEIVIVSNSKLAILQQDSNLIQTIDFLEIPANLEVYALYLADLNQNGYPEIYISASNGDLPSSMVLEWKKKGLFSWLMREVPYYLRPLESSDGTMILAGQKDTIGQEESSRALLDSPIYQLTSHGKDGVQVEATLQLPKSANIFNFVMVDLDRNGLTETIIIDQDNKITVFDNQAALLWASEPKYGFSKNYLGVPLVQLDDAIERENLYVTPKILVRDLNGDNRPDIILGRNKLTSPKYFKNLRSFDGGKVVALTWDGNKMTELWETMKINSYLADYDFIPTKTANQGDQLPAGDLYVAGHLEESRFSFLFPFKNNSKIQIIQISSKPPEKKKVQKFKPE